MAAVKKKRQTKKKAKVTSRKKATPAKRPPEMEDELDAELMESAQAPAQQVVVPEDLPTEIRGARELAVAANDRARSSIRDWVKSGLPYRTEGATQIFNTEEVIGWCVDRGIDFFDKAKKEPSPIQQEKYRQERHKANALQHSERLRELEYTNVAEVEEKAVLMMQQLMRHTKVVVDEIKARAGINGKAAEDIDALLIKGFNEIADLECFPDK
jgi:hypothetical protein